jgi:small subunit ribosomal protein S16
MAVVIRMRRTGRKNRPCYRINVADVRFPRDGRHVESLGLYDPLAPDPAKQIALDVERARHWVRNGARPSETVASIFRRFGVYEGLPTAKTRKREGRGKPTKGAERRKSAKAARAERKTQRRTERIAAKKAAAAASSGAPSEA